MSNRFNNRIQDGLDDLISGATGIRRSKIGQLKTDAADFRGKSTIGSFSARDAESREKVGETKKKVGETMVRTDVYKSPTLRNHMVFPEKIIKEDGSQETEFPNYIHFRKLERRAAEAGEELYDIFLYVPDTLNDNLAVSYSEAELGIIDSLISNFIKSDQVQEGLGIDKDEMATLAKSMAPGGKMIQSAQGRGVNPLKYQMFEQVAFRTFTYSFTLRPRSAAEAHKIRDILQVFKRETLPGVAGSNSRIYTFPTEWSIQFVGPIKNWVDFPLVSVCTGVNVDYAGGQPLALHHDGSPSVVTLTLSFTETTQLNRDKYDKWVGSNTRDLSDAEKGTNINAAGSVQAALRDEKKEKFVGSDGQGVATTSDEASVRAAAGMRNYLADQNPLIKWWRDGNE